MRTFTTSCILAGIVAVSAASPDTPAAHLDVAVPRRAIQHARAAQDGEHRPEHNGTHHRRPHHRPEHNGTHHRPEHNGTHHRRPHHGKHNGTELSREVHAAQFNDMGMEVQYGEHNGTHHGPHHGGQHNGTHHGPHHGGQHNGTHHGPHHGGQHNGTHHHRRPHPTRDAGDAEPLDFRPPTHGPFVLVGVAALAAGVAFFIGRRRRATDAAEPAHAGKLRGTYDAVPATPTDNDAKHVDEIDVVAV